MSGNPPSALFTSPTMASTPQPAPSFASLMSLSDRGRSDDELITKINGQRITSVKDIHIQYGASSPFGELQLTINIDPTKAIHNNKSLDFTTYGFEAEGFPPVLKKLQTLADDVHFLAKKVAQIRNASSGDKIERAYSYEQGITNIESSLWSFISGKTDEKQLTAWVADGMENLNVIELIQFLTPIVSNYRSILTDALSQVPQ